MALPFVRLLGGVRDGPQGTAAVGQRCWRCSTSRSAARDGSPMAEFEQRAGEREAERVSPSSGLLGGKI